MPSLRLFAVEGSAGEGASGNWTIPMGNCTPAQILNGRNTSTVVGKTFTYWSTVTGLDSVITDYMNAIDIPTGWYWMHDKESGYQIRFGLSRTGQVTFGPVKYSGTTIGLGAESTGSDVDDRVIVLVNKQTSYGSAYYLCRGQLSSTTGSGEVRGYGLQYAITFDGIDSLISGDSPYEPPSGQAGSDSSAGGSSSGGAGYPTGTNAGIPESKKNRANAGCDIYQCNAAAIRAFTKMLWGSSDSGFISAFFERVRNTVYNPINSIITCHSLPSAFAVSGGTAVGIKAGGVNFSTYDSACVGAPVSTEWSASPLYTFKPFEECWGNYSDYAKMSVALYLPFCGVVPLDPSSILGKHDSGGGGIAVQYWCNILNGNCAAFVCGWDREGDYKVLKIATGNCAQPCPISGNDRGMGQKLGALVGFAQGMVSMTGQAGNAMLSGNIGSMPSNAGLLNNYITAGSQYFLAPQHTSVVGSLNGAAGFAASTQIILMLDYGIPVETPNYTAIRARPSEVSGTVSSFSGYCEIEVHADGIAIATDEEKREIERLLLTGIEK